MVRRENHLNTFFHTHMEVFLQSHPLCHLVYDLKIRSTFMQWFYGLLLKLKIRMRPAHH